MKFFLIGLVIGIAIAPIGVWIYLASDSAPVAVADHPMPFERQIAHWALHQRVYQDAPKTVPMEASASNLQNGATIYRQQCAICHGLYGQPAALAKAMFPRPPQLWRPHGKGVVGVSDDPPGVTYWKVTNGIRLSAMPAFGQILNEAQRWQVSLLLAHANQSLPEGVLDLLKQPFDHAPQPAQ